MEGLSRISQKLAKGALRTGFLLGFSALAPGQTNVNEDIHQVLKQECPTHEDDPIDIKNIEASATSRRRLIKFHPSLSPILEIQESKLRESIEEAFDRKRSTMEIAELSSYDYLFRHHLPTKYHGLNWNDLPEKIQSYLKYLRFFAAQKIHHIAHCNETSIEPLIAKVMSAQITTESPEQAVTNAYSLPPLNEGGYVPFAKAKMPQGENVEIKGGRWRTTKSSHHIEALGIVVGSHVLYLHSSDYLSLTPENNTIVDGPAGLYAFAQPGPDEWCHSNLIITELRPIQGHPSEEERGGGNKPSDFFNIIQSGEKAPKNKRDGSGDAKENPPQLKDRRDLDSINSEMIEKQTETPVQQEPSAPPTPIKPIKKKRSAGPGRIPYKKNPSIKTQRSGGVCIADSTTKSDDPFDRIRRLSGRMDVHSIAATSKHEFCQWLGIPGNMRFTVQMVKGMPKAKPVYLAWQNPKQCKKASAKGNFCITMSDYPIAVSRSMAETLTLQHPRSVHVKMWDRDTQELIVEFRTQPRQ